VSVVNEFFDHLWQDYLKLAPQAQVIADHFAQHTAEVVNDHVAFRTFAGTDLDLDHLEPLLIALGYQVQAQYRFEVKKLRARSYQHQDPRVPKIFLSELLVQQLTPSAQNILERYTRQIDKPELEPDVFYSGRAWSMPSWSDYSALLAESEYAAWLIAIGLRANHFTISINHLDIQGGVSDVLEEVKRLGFAVNTTGGEVKGSPAVMLEQGSTMADQQIFTFSEGDQHAIPTCFYEFALRYPVLGSGSSSRPGNELFQGFVEGNADKIFDSTNSRE